MIFMKISWFAWNFHFSWKARKKFFTFFRKITFSHPRGRLPRMLFKPMKYYTFWGVLGAMGSLFEKKCVFIEILQKCRKSEKSWEYLFSSEKVKFHQIHDIAKTPIIPKEYQGFGASRFTKIKNFFKFHDFHEISWNFIKFQEFHDFYELSWFLHKKWETHTSARPDAQKFPKPLKNKANS